MSEDARQKKWKKLSDLSTEKLTPMLRQYMEAKAECGESLLFFRMGDFYELFFEDAVEAAELLGITLTSRDAVNKDDRIPMAGVPVRSVDGYLARCIKAGRTVAICEQVEDPKDAKGVVKRSIVRTVTPGTVMEADLLDERRNNYLAALDARDGKAGFALVDATTGEFLVAQVDADVDRVLVDELTRMAPAEVLVRTDAEHVVDALRQRFPSIAFTTRGDHEFDADYAEDMLKDQFGLGTLKGVRLDDAPQALACAGAVMAYLRDTQREAVPQLRLPRRYSPSEYVVLDGSTQRNLELVESMMDKSRRGTLLSVLDKTQTSMGGRKLRHWILHPLVDVHAVRERLDGVEALFDDAELRLRLRDVLREISDLERLLGRITARTGNGRDLQALGRSLEQAPRVRALIAENAAPLLRRLAEQVDPLEDVASKVAEAIVDEPPVSVMEGDVIRDGYDEELDRLRGLVTGGRDWIAALQRDESARTGITNLKVGYNKVFGYYIEVSKGQAHLAPDDYERKQTLVNAERFVTPSLKEREEEIVEAQEKMQRLEYELFRTLRDEIAEEARRIQETADALASIDALLSLADVAAAKGYCKPSIDGEERIRIRDGRHPVVEDLMKRDDFVPNDVELGGDSSLVIVTGPNMAGKSTFLRQAALIALMAQMGSFAPAAEAHIGVVDRIFTRVGASDNLVRGESTFMVEMIEAANILNTATEKSLIVLDEIGRGTSTFDGISIAWSVAEHIHDRIGAKTLFATHYHELTDLGGKLERAKNVNVAVREWGGKVVFLYRIVEGGADHSYGIQVAKLAGLPPRVLDRAREILDSLEAGAPATSGLPEQMYLFGAAPAEPSKVEQELEAVDPDDLSPKEAHEFLYHLKHLMNRPRDSKG
jgi:DNA mismatch repair protein MutS